MNNDFNHSKQGLFKKTGIMQVCSYTGFKPVIYDDGQGFEADLLRAIAKLWNVRIKFFPTDNYEGIWNVPGLNDHLIDVSAGGIDPIIHSKNSDKIMFSVPTATYCQSLLVRKADYDNGRITDYHSFKNTPYKIGVLGNSTGEKYGHLRAKEEGIFLDVFQRYDTEDDLLAALLQEDIAAIARGSRGNEYQQKIRSDLVSITYRNFNEMFAFALDVKNEELFAAINLAIKLILNDGEITYDSWFKNSQVFNERVKRLLHLGVSHEAAVI